VRTVIRDARTAKLDPRQRAIIDWATRATLCPEALSEADLEPLRVVGLSDRDLLGVAEVVGYYNYANRVVSMLGVEVEKREVPPFEVAPGLRQSLLDDLAQSD
jgi:uncharacterized peroxidase-related enzyme